MKYYLQFFLVIILSKEQNIINNSQISLHSKSEKIYDPEILVKYSIEQVNKQYFIFDPDGYLKTKKGLNNLQNIYNSKGIKTFIYIVNKISYYSHFLNDVAFKLGNNLENDTEAKKYFLILIETKTRKIFFRLGEYVKIKLNEIQVKNIILKQEHYLFSSNYDEFIDQISYELCEKLYSSSSSSIFVYFIICIIIIFIIMSIIFFERYLIYEGEKSNYESYDNTNNQDLMGINNNSKKGKLKII